MMNALCRDGNEVTFLANYGNGNLVSTLDSNIRVLSLCETNEGLDHSFLRRIAVTIEKSRSIRRLKKTNEEFDLIILGSHGMEPTITKKLYRANKYFKCIRTDFQNISGKEKAIRKIEKYKKEIDRYLCVSNTAKQSFDRLFPDLSDRSIVLYNFLDTNEMKSRSDNASDPFPQDGRFHISTVCRISDKSKGVFRMLDVCERLVTEGYDIAWYLVGDGADLNELRRRVKEKKLEDRFITVGHMSDPFGYYKYADLVAVLSYYEGLCGTVNEAKISGAAVIATEFSGIHEQLTDGVNGKIVDNDADSIFDAMKSLISDPDSLSRIKNDIYPKEITDDGYKLKMLYKELGWE